MERMSYANHNQFKEKPPFFCPLNGGLLDDTSYQLEHASPNPLVFAMTMVALGAVPNLKELALCLARNWGYSQQELTVLDEIEPCELTPPTREEEKLMKIIVARNARPDTTLHGRGEIPLV